MWNLIRKYCIFLVIGRGKDEMVKPILQKVHDKYVLNVKQVCTHGVYLYPETGCKRQKAAFHTCMIRYTYGNIRGKAAHGLTFENVKAAEMEAN
jgi:hypothetical protein